MNAQGPTLTGSPPASAATAGARRRAFERLGSVEDFRRVAERRLPRVIYDFVDGAAGHELTRRANEGAFQRYALVPRLLTDLTGRNLGTTVLGQRLSLPLLLGPSGMQRLAHPDGELAAARAAAAEGAGYVLSVGASQTLEDVARADGDGVRWFQIYLWEGRDWTRRLLVRARDAGYHALCVTIDSKSPGSRKYRDIRNGLSADPPRIDLRTAFNTAAHPRWLAAYLRAPAIRAVHLDDGGRNLGISLFKSPAVIQRRMDPRATWEEIGWLRDHWHGPLVIKGVLTPPDAERAFDTGADAIVCSNHGGRVLEGAPPTLHVLPRLVEVAVRRGREIFLDGGVRTGGDVVKAIALGARACLIARPFWWGLAVGGEDGVHQVLELFRKELETTMTQIGRPTLADLDPGAVELLPVPFADPSWR